jgi:hypothetical protein
MPFDPDKAAEVSYASAVLMLRELYAGADPDTQTELLLRILPYISSAVLAYCDATAGWKPVPRPNLNPSSN